MEQLIKINFDGISLEGMLNIPPDAKGIVLFAHGSGSSRLSPRNNFVAKELQKADLATLLIDLLTQEEDEVYETRFDINLLTDRLINIVHWLKKQPKTKELTIGIFGASTGAAAALHVAAKLGDDIAAVVSRGGRPDLAIPVLNKVTASTLLIVGGNDFGVIELNQEAYQALNAIRNLEIVAGATHLFEESGTLEKVAILAREWFKKYLNSKPKI
jgi:putative phosphoribosyl transferase